MKLKIFLTGLALAAVLYLKFFVDFKGILPGSEETSHETSQPDQAANPAGDTAAEATPSTP